MFREVNKTKILCKITTLLIFFLSVASLILLWGYVDFEDIIYYNISSYGYDNQALFAFWCVCTALFYLTAISSLVVMFDIKMRRTPVWLSISAVPCLIVTACILPENDLELFIHCGFAFVFCLLNYIAVSIVLFGLYKSVKTIFTKIVAFTFPCLSIIFIGLLIWQPMWGLTELLPLFFTMILLVFFVLFYKSCKKKNRSTEIRGGVNGKKK